MQMWGDAACKASSPKATNAEPASMIMPPPNVTGSLHIGHALTFTLQDIWIKFWRLQGRDVYAQPGLDHAGIATQMMVERALNSEGKTRQDLGRENFLDYAFAFKEKAGNTIIHQLKKLGVSANWDHLQFTLDPHARNVVRQVFVKLYNDGLVYKSNRLVYWDPVFKTALSNLEVINKDAKGHMYYVRYTAADNPAESITVATTRPETLFGDTAIAVHPDDERYQKWISRKVNVPFTERSVTVLADASVEIDKGSGALKITPAHDFTDYEIGQRHNLDAIEILDKEARLNEKVPTAFQGLSVAEARTKVVQALEEAGLLLEAKTITHQVPVGDRSGAVLEPRLTPQWYLNVKPLAEKALKDFEAGDLAFTPEHYGNTYKRWLSDIQPWCLSRQLWWGHDIPAWYGPDGKYFVAETEDEAQIAAEKHYDKKVDLKADPDVLDTWFSSGLWPLITLGWPTKTDLLEKFYPTSVLMTGFDIIFFWVARMTMLCTYLTGKTPFKTVYIHGLVRDADRQKMSKTKGNVINPLDVLDQYGPDPLRLALAMRATPGRDIAFSPQHVELSRNFLTKVWNATRFMHTKGVTFAGKTSQPKHPFNHWIIRETLQACAKYTDAMKAYRFDEAAQIVYHFLWNSYCDSYIELSKGLLADEGGPHFNETQNVTGWALAVCLQMLYPFAPLTSLELWKILQPHGDQLNEAPWAASSLGSGDFDNSAAQKTQTVLAWIGQIRRLRSMFQVPFKETLSLCVGNKGAFQDLGDDLVNTLTAFLNIEIKNELPNQKGFRGTVAQETFFVPLEGLVDLAAERTKLEKQKAKADAALQNLEKRLANPDFRSKADPNRIQETEEALKQAQHQKTALDETLKQIS